VSVGCGEGKLAYSKNYSKRISNSVVVGVSDGRAAAKVELVSVPFTMMYH
jgi:hypothetical protein